MSSDDRFRFSNELTHITWARVLIAQNKPNEAVGLLADLEQNARSAGRMGRVIETLILAALAMRQAGDSKHALLAFAKCLTLAEPEDYVRVFLDQGRPMHTGIYRARDDVFAVVHSHAPYATALAICGVCFPPITFDGFFVSKLPVVPFAMSGQELADAVLAKIGNWPGAFMQNHGLLTIGKDLRSAANLAETVEHMGQVLMIAKIVGSGELKTLPQEVVNMLDGMAADIMKMVY